MVAHVSKGGGHILLSMDILPEAMPIGIMIPAPAVSICFLFLLREEWGLTGKAPNIPRDKEVTY